MSLDRDYECPQCGAKAIVVVAAQPSKSIGEHAIDAGFGDDGMARQVDATRILGLVTCPVCGQRPAGAMVWPVTRVIGYLIGGLFLAIMLAAMGPRRSAYHRVATVPDWIWYALIAVFVAAGVYLEVRRFRAAGRVRFDRVRPRLPVAVAREVPRADDDVPQTEAIEPLRTSAPEHVERASDEDGPRFLKNR